MVVMMQPALAEQPPGLAVLGTYITDPEQLTSIGPSCPANSVDNAGTTIAKYRELARCVYSWNSGGRVV